MDVGAKMIAQAPLATQRSTSQGFLDPVTEFYKRLLPVKAVEAMYVDREVEGLAVWLVVNKATEADREQIYAQELALMQVHPGLALDTHLIDRSEVNLIDVIDLSAVDAFLRFPRFS
jgi:hypothetical protein